MENRMKKIIPSLSAVLLATLAGAQSEMRISFPGYNNRPESLFNFPARVTFADNIGGSGFSFAGHAFLDENGFDLRFHDAKGDPLDYEIDTWDTNGVCVAWVRVPEIRPDGLTHITASWGDPAHAGRLPCTTNGAVWADGFIIVQHYNETDGTVRDSSGNNHHGYIAHKSGAPVSGIAGRAANLSASAAPDGRENCIVINHRNGVLNMGTDPNTHGVPINGTGEWTMSAWFKGLLGPGVTTPAGDTWRTLTRGPTAHHHIILEYDSYKLGAHTAGINGGFGQAGTATLAPDPAPGVWRHITAVGKDGKTSYYVDGALLGTGDFKCDVDLFAVGGFQGLSNGAGNQNPVPKQKFADYLDEFRAAGHARSAHWVWASFKSEGGDPAFTAYHGPFAKGELAALLAVEKTPQAAGNAAVPAFGTHFITHATVDASIDPVWTNAAGNVLAVATGWKTFTNDASLAFIPAESGNTLSFTYANPGVTGKIVWEFAVSNRVAATAGPGGSVIGNLWAGEAGTFDLTAVPDSGHVFYRWTGDVPGPLVDSPSVSLPAATPLAVRASFYPLPAGDTQHVAPNGNDASNGLSWASAKLTLQAALNEFDPSGGTVLLAPGQYGVNNPSAPPAPGAPGTRSAITLDTPVTVRGATGNAADVLVFRNAGELRVFNIDHPGASVEFVTVANGANPHEGNETPGVNIRIGPNGGTVADCVIQNGNGDVWFGTAGGNIALLGADARLLRSVVQGGTARFGGGVYMTAGRVESCLIIGNRNENASRPDASSAGGSAARVAGGVLANCTLARNLGTNGGAVNVTGAGRVVNCVIVDNTTLHNPPAAGGTVYCGAGQEALFTHCVADLFLNGTCLTTEDGFGFVDAANNNYRPTAAALARDAGTNAYAPFEGTDLDGKPRVLGAAIDAGCYEYPDDGVTLDVAFDAVPRRHAVPVEVAFTAVVVNAAAPVAYVWEFGDGAVETTGVPFTTHEYTTPGSHTARVTATAANGVVSRTVAAFMHAAPAVIHVRQGSASPAFPHDSFANALPDIPGALALAGAGSVILISNGVYSVSSRQHMNLPAVLRGLTGNPWDVRIQHDWNVPGGVRNGLLRLNHPGARVEGVTLANGNLNVGDEYGGNVHLFGGGTVSNCVITGGATHEWFTSGGGVYLNHAQGLVTHCVVTDNSCGVGGVNYGAGVVMLRGRLEHSLISGNRSQTGNNDNPACAGGVGIRGGSMVNCTVAGNSGQHNGGVHATGGYVLNTVVAGNTSVNYNLDDRREWGGSAPGAFTNCWSGTGAAINGFCFFAPVSSLLADAPKGDYRPGPGSLLIDAGAPIPHPVAVDLDGKPRFTGNGAIDVGCYEFDDSVLSVSFTATPVSGFTPVEVEFTAHVNGVDPALVQYDWDFGGGMSATVAGLPVTTNEYASGGIFDVTLTITHAGQTASFTREKYLRYAPRVLHVKKDNGGSIPFESEANAASTPHEAFALAIPGCEIILHPGTYPIPSTVNISIPLRVRGATGNPADVVFENAVPWSGNNDARVLMLNHKDAWVEGITLHGGWSRSQQGGNLYIGANGGTFSNGVIRSGFCWEWVGSGAAVGMAGADALVTHCVITNNSTRGALGFGEHKAIIDMRGGRLENCLVTRNFPDPAYNMPSSVIRVYGSSVGPASHIRNCTIAGNTMRSNGAVWFEGGPTSTFTHCVIAGNTPVDGGGKVWGGDWNGPNRFTECVADEFLNGTCREAEATDLFKNFAAGNYIIKTGSQAVDISPRLSPQQIAALPAVDLAGRPRVINNRVDAGCYESPAPGTLLLVR